jgi:6-phosphogluconolactonase/glucosamine-6-phosphate isomerase/deaminase
VKIEAFPDAESAARESAKVIAEEAGTAVVARGKCVMAASGGKTP